MLVVTAFHKYAGGVTARSTVATAGTMIEYYRSRHTGPSMSGAGDPPAGSSLDIFPSTTLCADGSAVALLPVPCISSDPCSLHFFGKGLSPARASLYCPAAMLDECRWRAVGAAIER